MKNAGTHIVFLTILLICALCLCLVFSACDNGVASETTDPVHSGANESTADEDVTVAPPDESADTDEGTEEISGEDTSEEIEVSTEEETTAEPKRVTVYVYGEDGSVKDYLVEAGDTLSAAALEAAFIPESSDKVKVEHIGWEYALSEGGERKVYLTDQPPVAADSGMYIYPVVEYSYLVCFEAGEGAFSSGTVTSFFVKSGEGFNASSLLDSLPAKASDKYNDYPFAGFLFGDKAISADETVSISEPAVLVAQYAKKEIVYSVSVTTEHGELIGGGKTQTFKGNYSDAEKFLASYENYSPEAEYVGDVRFDFKELKIDRSGREWKLELVWDTVETRFDVIFDYNNGETLKSKVFADGVVILPTPKPLEDEIRYYDFVGWRDSSGQLYNGGYHYTVTSDVSFVAEYVDGDKKIYSVIFETDIGLFENGSPIIVITGYYGDPLVPPVLKDQIFGEVVYSFVGWNSELIPSFTENAEYSAIFTTPHPVYTLNYYLNGELYISELHYESTPLTPPERPEGTEKLVFSGWIDLPDAMPAGDLNIYATTKAAEVIYILDGEVVSCTEVGVGDLVTLAAPAQKHGHTVSGWTSADIDNVTDGSFIMPESDVVFSATSTPNPHSVTYVLDGGVVYTDSVLFGDSYTVRGIEVKEGFAFIGWHPQTEGAAPENGVLYVPDHDVIFVGSFEKCTYTVNYYLDGVLVYSDSYSFGDTVILRGDEVQEGCTFEWKSAGADISGGSFAMPAGDVDIYGIFSDGDNRLVYMIDGKEYAVIGVGAGHTVSLLDAPTKLGYTFTGWTCSAVDISSGEFIMPEGELILRGSFIPNAHILIFIDMSNDSVINTSHLDYGSSFSLGDRIYCDEGRISNGWVLLSGDAIREGDNYIMPDSDVIFGIVWVDCLTLKIDAETYIPWFALVYDEYEGCRYDEATKMVYITDPAITVAGESEGVSVVYEYEIQE